MQVAGSTTAPCARVERRADPPGPPPAHEGRCRGDAHSAGAAVEAQRGQSLSQCTRLGSERTLHARPCPGSARGPRPPGRVAAGTGAAPRASPAVGSQPGSRVTARRCPAPGANPSFLSPLLSHGRRPREPVFLDEALVHVTSACSQVTLAVRSSPSVTSPLHPSPPSALRSPRLCFSVILSPSTREESRAESGAGNASPRTWED